MRVVAAILVMVAIAAAATPTSRLERIALDAARGPALVLRVSGPVAVWAHPLKPEGEAGDRIFIDLDGAQLGPELPRQLPGAGPVLRIRAGQFSPTTARVVLDLAEPLAFTVRQTPDAIMLELRPRRDGTVVEPPPASPRPPPVPEARMTPPEPPVARPDGSTTPTREPRIEARAAIPAPTRPVAGTMRALGPRWAPQPMWTPQVSRATPPVVAVRGATPTSPPRPTGTPRGTTPTTPPETVTAASSTTPTGAARPVVVARGVTPAGTLPPPVPPARHPTSPGAPPAAERLPVVASAHPVSEQHPAGGVTPAGPPPAVARPGETPVTPPLVLVARADTPRAPGPLAQAAEPSRTTKPSYTPPPVRAAPPLDALHLPNPPPPQIAGLAPRRDAVSPPVVPSMPPPLIVIDAGHGGRDPGAAGIGGVLEKHVVLAAAHRLAERLSARLPVTVLLTRTDDSFVPIDERLARQGEAATLFISLHANASTDSRANGIEVFYGGGVLRHAGPPGPDPRAVRFGGYVAEALSTRLGGLRGGARPGEFRVLTHNPTPGTLVEIGYLTHADDAALAQTEAYQLVLADALIDAVAAFLRGSSPVL